MSLLAVYSIFWIFEADFKIRKMEKWSIFLTIFFFSIFVCTLKYVNMIRISNISFFRFCWKNGKLDWPKCARTVLQGKTGIMWVLVKWIPPRHHGLQFQWHERSLLIFSWFCLFWLFSVCVPQPLTFHEVCRYLQYIEWLKKFIKREQCFTFPY